MTPEHQLAAIIAAIFLFAAFSRRLTARWLTMHMLFVGLGLVAGSAGLGLLALDPHSRLFHILAEATLVLVLFADASRIRVAALRRKAGLPLRLLGIGLPLTIVAGAGAAMLLFPEWSVWEAALAAAILAPTDAALGQPVVSHPAVPQRVRQALNVESGLNDGIALPVVLVLLALGGEGEGSAAEWVQFWVLQVTLGPLVGVLIGGGAGRLLRIADQRGWSESASAAIGSLAAAALCYLGAELVGGNGFMAAFVGGMAFGTTSGPVGRAVHDVLEVEGELLMIAVFLLVGSALAGPALAHATPAAVAYAALSLTVLRMIPVAVALIGSKASWVTVGFIGWFGPRGLASVLFGLLLLEATGLGHHHDVFAVVVLTVVGSVALHGVTAAWGAERYAARLSAEGMEHEPVHAHPLRRRLRPNEPA